jgi:ATP diphosphatase
VQIEELLAIMARLRDPASGCPWDREQDFRSIAPYTVEEAYEVADAIERGDLAGLRDELGDLLLQVVFHAQLASEQGAFDFAAVVDGICDKLVRRHPHVFGGAAVADAAAQSRSWEDIKAAERAAIAERAAAAAATGGAATATPAASVLDGVPRALPALVRAVKLGRRAARLGFDWPDAHGARAKLDEELAELDAATARRDRAAIAAEFGDVLLALSNLARHLEVDAESALRAANARFERRFRHVESRRRASGAGDPATLEAYWMEAKEAERAAGAPPASG